MNDARAPARSRQRAVVVVRGGAGVTRARAWALVAELAPADVLWIGPDAPEGLTGVRARAVAGLLGGAYDAVVVSLHDPRDEAPALGGDQGDHVDLADLADLIGQSHGFVRAGGALLLRMPDGPWALATRAALAAFPYGAADVGQRFERRFEAVLARYAEVPDGPLVPTRRDFAGTPEQAEVVRAMVARWQYEAPQAVALTADRGRGKSSALGLAAREAGAAGRRVVVTAGQIEAVREVLRFADGRATFVPIATLIAPGPESEPEPEPASEPDILIVDESAQLPVPALLRLALRYPRAHLAFATTVRGYEGTGRGFVLRFLAWLERQARPLTRLTLPTPIRWDPGDRLERFTFDALLLGADLPEVTPPSPAIHAALEAATLDRDLLATNERDLGDLFGLLVHAHYRTTPSDLHRLLDAPNLIVHALRLEGRIVAACLVAREGGLTPAMCDDLVRGRGRIRAHALADALVAHLGHADAGTLTMIRSVRIAVHPALRRLGLARRLVAHVHASHAPDLFGTLFGATAELIQFRRDVGYEVVRVSASRGVRTGEPSVLMLRPVSAASHALVTELRSELARELPRQLELLEEQGAVVLAPELRLALLAGLPSVTPLSPAACKARVRAYTESPRTFESVATTIAAFVTAHPDALATLPPADRILIETRAVAGQSWASAMRAAGQPSIPATMRALRRAVRALFAATD